MNNVEKMMAIAKDNGLLLHAHNERDCGTTYWYAKLVRPLDSGIVMVRKRGLTYIKIDGAGYTHDEAIKDLADKFVQYDEVGIEYTDFAKLGDIGA